MTDTQPWSFEPFEIDAAPEPTWPVYDPNLARIVAIFYTEHEAREYLRWRNKKQAKLRAKADAKKAAPWLSLTEPRALDHLGIPTTS